MKILEAIQRPFRWYQEKFGAGDWVETKKVLGPNYQTPWLKFDQNEREVARFDFNDPSAVAQFNAKKQEFDQKNIKYSQHFSPDQKIVV